MGMHNEILVLNLLHGIKTNEVNTGLKNMVDELEMSCIRPLIEVTGRKCMRNEVHWNSMQFHVPVG